MRLHWFVAIGLIALVTPQLVAAQITPSVSQQARDIKTLTPQEIDDLLNARGASLAKAAELNGYPGPAQAMEMSADLGLSAEQVDAIQAVRMRVELVAKVLGGAIIDAESELDRAFADRAVTKARVDSLVGSIASLQGRLRALHLGAYVDTVAALHPWQIGRYNELRGFYIAAHQPTQRD